MQVQLDRLSGERVWTPCTLTPTRYSHAAMGGPDTAEIAVSGDSGSLADALTWLAHHVLILNDGGQPVWWGVVQAVSLRLDGVEYELDASEIVNCMAVVYTDEAGGQAASAWVEDAHSIARYGRRERRVTAQATTDATAQAQAARMVNERSAPMRSVKAAAGPNGAVLRCVGYWRSLDWRYWSRDGGQILQDESANTTELLGWSITSDEVGFNRPLLRIGTLGAVLHPLAKTDRIVASGSGSNSGVYEVTASDERAGITTYTSDEISFDTSDDVHDDDGLFNQFRAGDLLQISGAVESGNNGAFWLKDMFQNGDGGYNHMRVKPGTIVDETAGATVTIAAGNSVGVSPRPAAWENPGWMITLRAQALALAQAFTVSAAAAWELSEIWIQAARVGAPSDSLEVALCTDASGAPGTVVKQATITGADLPLTENMDWVQWTFDHALMLNPATTYWVVVSRTGSPDDDAYRVGLLEAAEDLSANSMLLWDGSSWAARSVASELDARLSLRIYGQRVTTSQIIDIVLALGDWLNGISIRTASGLRTRLFRAAEDAQTALSEVKALLEFGTVGGERLLAQVSAERILVVDVQPLTSKTRYRWTAEGLRDRLGLPLTPGVLPVGEWVAFDALGAVDAFGPALLEAAEFDVGRGTVRPSFRGEQPVQTLARLTQPAALPDLAARLRPLLDARPATGRVSGAQSFTPPSQADYILSVDGGNCIAIHGMTGVVIASGANHAAIIQQAINLAGVGGSLAFHSDVFLLNSYVQPLGSQTWHCMGATFQPTANTTVLRIYEIDHFKLLGSLNIIDAGEVTTSQPAIYVYSMRYAQIEHIFIRDYYNGIDLEGNTSGAGTNENVFVNIYMQVRNRGMNLAGSCHDNKFLQVWCKGPAPDVWATGPGIRIGTGGTQGGNSIDRCQILDMNVCLDLPGAYEFWFGTVICDNAFGNAIYIAGSCERLFFDTIWASSSGNGIYIEGNEIDYPTTAADKIYIGKCYAWLNADYGVRLEGYVQQLTFDLLVVQRNDNVGLAFNRWRNAAVRIGTLISSENAIAGVDGTGAGIGCAIKNAFIYDSILSPGNFETLQGARDTGAFQNRGTALILNGETTSVVLHRLAYTPIHVLLGHEHSETTGAYVSAKNSSTFTITVPSAVTAQRSVHWQAEAVRKTVGNELIANADIEAGTSDPDDWYASVSGATWDSTVKRTGYKSLKLDVSAATADWRSAYFAVIGDREYQVQGVFKGTGSADCFLTIRWFSNADGTSFISEVNATLNAAYSAWTPVSFQAQSPSNALSADVMFRCPSSTTVSINGDDFSVKQLL